LRPGYTVIEVAQPPSVWLKTQWPAVASVSAAMKKPVQIQLSLFGYEISSEAIAR
jgi:hypothetical protein